MENVLRIRKCIKLIAYGLIYSINLFVTLNNLRFFCHNMHSVIEERWEKYGEQHGKVCFCFFRHGGHVLFKRLGFSVANLICDELFRKEWDSYSTETFFCTRSAPEILHSCNIFQFYSSGHCFCDLKVVGRWLPDLLSDLLWTTEKFLHFSYAAFFMGKNSI